MRLVEVVMCSEYGFIRTQQEQQDNLSVTNSFMLLPKKKSTLSSVFWTSQDYTRLINAILNLTVDTTCTSYPCWGHPSSLRTK